MKKKINVSVILLLIYLIVIVGIYLAIVYPVILRPKGLTRTKIPSLSVSDLNEANRQFNASGKSWVTHPTEPDINGYIFGQRDPQFEIPVK